MANIKTKSVQTFCKGLPRLQITATETATAISASCDEPRTTSLARLLRLLPFANSQPHACNNVQMLREYVNLDLVRQIVEDNRTGIAPRDPTMPPTECGLMAIAAYTAGHLHRKIAEMEQRSETTGYRPEFRQLMCAKSLIATTVSRIAKTDVPVVRRNVQLTRDVLALYQPGRTVQFHRLTSVTCSPTQVYTGGNVDFVIHTANGVVNLDPLSHFKNNGAISGGGEAEGMPDIDSHYKVVDVVGGKESGKGSLDEALYPALTITLHEIDAADQSERNGGGCSDVSASSLLDFRPFH